MAPAQEPRGIVVDPRTLIVGGCVAAVGVTVLVFFLWMVPHAAVREAHAACAGLGSQPPINAKVCPNGGTCTYPIPTKDFTAYDNNGKPVHLTDFRGKVVLLNFWASWCGVCKTEKPHLQQMAAEMAGKDFVVIALASDRNWSDVLLALVDALAPNVKLPSGKDIPLSDALRAYQLGLPAGTAFKVLLDPPKGDDNIGQIAASWGITAVPETALIDRQGNLRHYFVNKRDWQMPVAETCLRSVIDDE
jgi:thiol-disulfide isomerase/thioredoxin